MNRFLTLCAAFLLLLAVPACDSFVEDVDDPIDSISDDQLNDESQVPFIIRGVQSRFSTTWDRITVFAGGLSDELIFDTDVPNATFPSFQEMDDGDISFANNSNDGVYNDANELRFFSDNLLARLGEITFEDAALKQEAEFTANLYGGIARYLLATYYGLNPREGGGVISEDAENPGPFIPSAQLYEQALAKFNAALPLAPDDYTRRVVHSIIARTHLYAGDVGAAQAAAQAGLVAGDAPFQSLHSVENTNYWYVQAGQGRTQWVVDFRFQDLVENNPEEAARIQLEPIEGNDGTTFYRQALYLDRSSPLTFISWQETALMRAEIALRNNDTGTALDLINEVRASHSLAPRDAASLDVLIEERERELFTLGARLVDQRRFDRWHLGPDTWQYLPITQSERNANPNF
ncbi:MAG: hypothetical protein R3247_03315 [Rhodothermales bacterium]|nr:hypothetical protein [Rhodothermales bacterium]